MLGVAELPSDSASDENPEVHLWQEQAYAELANLKLMKNKGLLYDCTAAHIEEYQSLIKPLKNYLRRPDHDVTHINAFGLNSVQDFTVIVCLWQVRESDGWSCRNSHRIQGLIPSRWEFSWIGEHQIWTQSVHQCC